ncbi:MAG: hypothetical protein KKF98_09840 [Bacteroidetes bacterium]|nr:hypothetical protein [Bacteroidota bacterium]
MKSLLNSLMCLAAIPIITLSCKKNDSPPKNILMDNITYWEFNMIENQPDSAFLYYQFRLSQEDNKLSGEIIVRDHETNYEGTVTGTINDNSVVFSSNFDTEKLNFSFAGKYDNSQAVPQLLGEVDKVTESIGNGKKVNVVINKAEDFYCPQVFPDNEYVFKKVWSSGHPGDSVVIFIHGMTGKLTNWDAIISKLSSSFKEKHDVYVYQYNWKDSIMINGKILFDSVQAAGLSNPILVGHSMGGLVARAYVAVGGSITRFVSLGAPNLGTPLVNRIGLLCFLDFPGPQNMLSEGDFINNLLNNPNDIASRNKYVVFDGQMSGHFHITTHPNEIDIEWVWAESYYSTKAKIAFDVFRLFGKIPNDCLMPTSSALFEGYEVLERKPILKWVDHFSLINPDRAPEIMGYINNL